LALQCGTLLGAGHGFFPVLIFFKSDWYIPLAFQDLVCLYVGT
jgi:hypothetical protein